MKSILVIGYEFLMQAIFALPRFRWCVFLKTTLLRFMGARIGRAITIYPGVWIAPGRNLTIGDNVDLAYGVLITTSGGVTIGDRTLIGYRTQIFSSNHVIPDNQAQIFGSGHTHAPVSIGKDVWIGGNCILLPGITVGEGAVIAAGSVVTKDVPSFTIVAGNPARVLRIRKECKESNVTDESKA